MFREGRELSNTERHLRKLVEGLAKGEERSSLFLKAGLAMLLYADGPEAIRLGRQLIGLARDACRDRSDQKDVSLKEAFRDRVLGEHYDWLYRELEGVTTPQEAKTVFDRGMIDVKDIRPYVSRIAEEGFRRT